MDPFKSSDTKHTGHYSFDRGDEDHNQVMIRKKYAKSTTGKYFAARTFVFGIRSLGEYV